MQVEWYGQSAFRLEADGTVVFIDPFGDVGARAASRGMRFEYPPIAGVEADLLLITHEHFDHNAAEAIGGEPAVLRSTAGRLESPLGEVLAVASEHDPAAGTERGPNTIFAFMLGDVRVAHFGDFGQRELREEQARAIGEVDMLVLPMGGGPTIGAAQATAIAGRLKPRWVVPMHYRTERVNFLEPLDAALERFGRVQTLATPMFDTEELESGDGTLLVVPAAP
jgi:L-ascorbate metabolism protein UlaG (beta-lactamase superfamily)